MSVTFTSSLPRQRGTTGQCCHRQAGAGISWARTFHPLHHLMGPSIYYLSGYYLHYYLYCYNTGQLRGWWPCRPQNSYPHLTGVTPSSLLCHLNGLLGRGMYLNICAVLSTATNILTAWYLLCLCKKVNIAKIKPVSKKGLSISIFWQLLRCEVILQFSCFAIYLHYIECDISSTCLLCEYFHLNFNLFNGQWMH